MKRNHLQLGMLAVLAAFPWIPGAEEIIGSVNQAAVFAIVAISLVLLTGWVGQISLGHAALVGIGAYATGFGATSFEIPFPFSILFGAGLAAAAAALLGIVALRVRGLYLAVATLVFSWAASEYLFRAPWVLRYYQIPDQPIGTKGTLPYFDFSGSRISFFYIAWGIAVALLFTLSNLRDSRTGRAFFAIRGSEMAAASLGVNVLRYKLLAFVLSGALAGVAGNLIMTHARVVSPDSFDFLDSLFFLSIAVVGGLASLPGVVASSMLFASLNEVFFRVPGLGDYLQIVSTGLLALTFRIYPSGLAGLGRLAARKLRPPLQRYVLPAIERAAARGSDLLTKSRAGVHILIRKVRPASDGAHGASSNMLTFEETPIVEPVSANGDTPEIAKVRLVDATPGDDGPPTGPRDELRPLIEASNIVVKFGGLTAVNDASLTVREGEIVGLIGPNGAGKTTLFNSIAGFNTPTSGTVKIHGVDVTQMPVHRRAELGMARTFQLIQLFPQLSVFDNLLAATHLQNATGFVRHMMATGRALEAEAIARARVRHVVDLLDLHDVALRPVAGLPFGVLRMIEVARALVTGSKIIMLDEPASGLDNRETDNLIEVLRFVRGLGATLLLIEHDVRMVTGVSDYMYVLNQGKMIAEGVPSDIQSQPEVIAAYLGRPPAEEVKV